MGLHLGEPGLLELGHGVARADGEVRVSVMEVSASVWLGMRLGVEALVGGPRTAAPLGPPYWRLRRAKLRKSSVEAYHTGSGVQEGEGKVNGGGGCGGLLPELEHDMDVNQKTNGTNLFGPHPSAVEAKTHES